MIHILLKILHQPKRKMRAIQKTTLFKSLRERETNSKSRYRSIFNIFDSSIYKVYSSSNLLNILKKQQDNYYPELYIFKIKKKNDYISVSKYTGLSYDDDEYNAQLIIGTRFNSELGESEDILGSFDIRVKKGNRDYKTVKINCKNIYDLYTNYNTTKLYLLSKKEVFKIEYSIEDIDKEDKLFSTYLMNHKLQIYDEESEQNKKIFEVLKKDVDEIHYIKPHSPIFNYMD